MRRKRVRCDAQIADFQHGLGLAALSGMLPSDNACCLETRELLISRYAARSILPHEFRGLEANGRERRQQHYSRTNL